MKILGIIPARGGSKGIKNKNIVPLLGKPLLAYTAEAALASTRLTKVVLSTDSPEIAAVGRSLGLEVPFLRPEVLAKDDTPTLPVLLHAIEEMGRQGDVFDAVCLLQPTAPLRTAEMIDEACRIFLEQQADTLLSVLSIPFHHHPEWALVERDPGCLVWASGRRDPIPRRQQLPPAFHREGSIYIVKTDVLVNESTLYGKKIVPYIVDASCSVNIDSQEDLDLAKKILKGRRH